MEQKSSLIQVKDKKRLMRIVRRRRFNKETSIRAKRNGCKWWDKMMRIYYGSVTAEDIVNCKQNTTSDIILNFEQINTPSKSYAEMFLFPENLNLFEEGIIPFLFRGRKREESEQTEQSSEEIEDLHQLVVYKYKKIQDQNKDETIKQVDPNKFIPVFRDQDIYRHINIEENKDTNASLQYLGSITDSDTIFGCLLYQENLIKHNYNHIHCELDLLSKKLEQVHSRNIQLWDKAIISHQQESKRLEDLQNHCSQTSELQTKIACRQRLFYFKKGFSCKTQDQLEQALQEMMIEEKRLAHSKEKSYRLASYNDCKICFYPEIKLNNKIIFCTVCRTSYHNHCYGLESPDQESTYICDACLWMEQKGLQFEDVDARPECQICLSKKQFPLKNVQGRFYHVTCLFFFQIADEKSFQIRLKHNQQNDHKINLEENDIRCQYCLPQNQQFGLRFKCSQYRCTKTFHPICAYLRGCIFDIARPNKLQVKIRCEYHSYHNQQDDQIRQVYLRRFFCNYKNIQKQTQDQFRIPYSEEKQQIINEIRRLRQGQITWEQYDNLRKKVKKNEFDYEFYKSLSLEQLMMGDFEGSQKKDKQTKIQSDSKNEFDSSEGATPVQEIVYDCDNQQWTQSFINID